MAQKLYIFVRVDEDDMCSFIQTPHVVFVAYSEEDAKKYAEKDNFADLNIVTTDEKGEQHIEDGSFLLAKWDACN